MINLLAFVVTSILGCLAILFAAAADNGVSPREYAWKLADDLRLALSKARSVHRGLVVLAWQSFPARWWQLRYVGANPETIWRARVHWLGLTIGILTKSWKKPIVLSRQLRRQIARKGASFRNEDGQIWRVMQALLLAMVIPMAMGCAKHLGIEPPGGPAIDCEKTPELCRPAACAPKVDPNWILAAHRARETGSPEPPARMVETCEASGAVEALDRRIEESRKRELIMYGIDYYLARSGEAWWSK